MEHVRKSKAVLIGSMLLAIAGCQSVPIEELPANADPSAEISRLEAARDEALGHQADILSPANYKEANDYLSKARSLRSDNADNKKILNAVAEGLAYIKRADATVKAAEDVMPEVVTARAQALQARAGQYAPNDLKSADEKLRSVSSDLEDDDKGPALKQRGELQTVFAAVTLEALEKSTVGTAKNNREQAIKEGAKKYAPQTLATMDSAIIEGDSFVVVNKGNPEALAQKAQQLTNESEHLLKVTRESKALKTDNGESIVLQQEAEQARLAAAKQALQQKEAQLNAKDAQLNQQAAALDQSMAFNSALANNAMSEQAMRAKIKQVQSRFSPQEAAVFEQGNTVIIRLKDLAFPSGKADIPSQRFPLLSKVREVVGEFPGAQITVIGHTDSTGNAAKNQALSLARAQSIASYLQSAPTNGQQGGQSQIRTEGDGDKQPIAPNNTAAGRAENRRVDLIITPQSSSEVAH